MVLSVAAGLDFVGGGAQYSKTPRSSLGSVSSAFIPAAKNFPLSTGCSSQTGLFGGEHSTGQFESFDLKAPSGQLSSTQKINYIENIVSADPIGAAHIFLSINAENLPLDLSARYMDMAEELSLRLQNLYTAEARDLFWGINQASSGFSDELQALLGGVELGKEAHAVIPPPRHGLDGPAPHFLQ